MVYLISKILGPKVARVVLLLIAVTCFSFLIFLVARGSTGIWVILLGIGGVYSLFLALRPRKKIGPGK
jgi:uncharacterized membrane protein